MKKLLLSAALTSQLMFGMSNRTFEKKADRWAAVFGLTSVPHAIIQVDLPTLQVVTPVAALAASWWDEQTGMWVAWVLSDKGLDQFAEAHQLKKLTPAQKHAIQEEAIVHELTHCVGVSSEGATWIISQIVKNGAYNKSDVPSWFAPKKVSK